MMKKALLILSTVFVFGCAKNRDVERVRAGDKENIIQKSAFLGGENGGERTIWLGKMTVVDTSSSPGAAAGLFVGFQGDVKMGYFDFTETSMQFKSVSGLYQGNESENLKNSVLLSWRVEHLDFALDESDGQTMNKEIQDNFKIWEQKKFFRIGWDANLTNEKQMLPISALTDFMCWTPASVRQVEKSMKLEPDHIGFKVEVVYQQNPLCAGGQQWNEGDFNFTVTYKYSFKKSEQSDYQPKFYTNEQDPARYKYGHFQTVRKVENPKNGQPHNIFMENRWAEKTHYFYFVKGFPQKFKWLWDHTQNHTVLGQTNALLKSMGSKLRFEIYDYNYNHETGKADGPEREFGDLRYSFINFIEEIEAGGTPLGYGPSDTNPLTGEIIAANTMVWTGMLGFYFDLIDKVGKNSVNEEGEEKQSSLFIQLNSALNVEDVNTMITDWDQTQGVGKIFKHMADKTRYTHPGWNSYTAGDVGQIMVPTLVEKYSDGKNHGETGALSAGIFSDIISVPLKETPFKFETRLFNGSAQFKIKNALEVFDTSWLEALAQNGQSAGVQTSGMRNFLKILQNMQKANDKNFQGQGSLESVAHEYYQKRMRDIHLNEDGHCIMDIDDFAGGFAGYLSATKMDVSDPAVRADILNTVLYRVSIHEFGHNLNLRHNFYGSVDKDNFGIAKGRSYTGSNGLAKLNKDGKRLEGQREQISSSVMDYLRLEDELNTPWAWEDYDIMAIADSYKKGFTDNGNLYLFCTDEHTLTSALCNRHDLGTTPSQILMSQIRTYDERYEIRNKRFGRAFWSTVGYQSAVLETMVSMKEFLPLWRSGFSEDIVFEKMEQMGINNKNVQSAYLEELNREMRKVMKITMAFYQAVIQQSRGDRDYRSEYDEVTGALKQIGIMPDKIFAMLLLAGDDTIFYNPNRIMLHNSFLTYSRQGDLADFTDQIWRNIVTDRNIAMEPWFINFARVLYAKNATNFDNRNAASLINKMKVIRVENAQDLMNQFGLKMEVSQPALRTTLMKSESSAFFAGDDVVVVHVDGSYYMTAVGEGDITYSLFQDALDKITGTGDDTVSLQQFNMDVRELHFLYDIATTGALQ